MQLFATPCVIILHRLKGESEDGTVTDAEAVCIVEAQLNVEFEKPVIEPGKESKEGNSGGGGGGGGGGTMNGRVFSFSNANDDAGDDDDDDDDDDEEFEC